MKQYYESEVLYKLMERDGFNIPSSVPPYESEIKAYLINQVKQAYPKLTDYEAEWLLYNYTKHLPADFPINSVSNVSTATFKNVVPFAYQSAILKGNTLVNLASDSAIGNGNINNQYSTIIFLESSKLKPSTDYTFVIYNDSSENNALYTQNLFPFNAFDVPSQSVVKMKTKSVSIFEQTSCPVLSVWANQTAEQNLRVMLLEGDYTNIDIPYFNGMKSVKLPVLTTTGKNLFDFKNAQWLKGGNFNPTYGNSGNIVIENKSLKLSNPSSCVGAVVDGLKPNTEYYISAKITNTSTMVINSGLIYSVNNTTINGGINRKQTTNSNGELAISIGVYNANTNGGYVLVENIQVEEGTQATTYEPYKSNILTVNEEVELRGIGDVKDTLDCLTGEVTERIGEIVLDGSEQWRLVRTGESTFLFGCDDYIIGTSTTSSQSHICNTFKVCAPDANGGIWDRDEESIAFKDNDTNKIRIRILKSKVSNLISFKSWLSSNPVTVQYKLTEKVHKTVDLTTVNENGEKVYFMPLEGIMNVSCSSQTINPTFDMSVPVEATTQNLASFINLEIEGE